MQRRWRVLRTLLVLLMLVPIFSWAQSELINGDRVLVGTLNYCADAGSTDAYACNLDPVISTYITGAHYLFKANTANTGAATLALNGLAAKTIVKVVGGITATLSDNDIRVGQFVDVVYDGTNLQMQSTLANFPASLATNGANCTAGNLAAGVDASGVAEGCTPLSAINPQTATYQVLAADFDGYKTISVASGTFTITLVASGTQPANGKYIKVVNYGSGVVTITRSGQNINGGTTSLTLAPGSATNPQAASVVSDGTNYFAFLSTANPMTTAGDIVYAGTNGQPTRLPTGTGKQLLIAGTTPSYIDFPDFHYFPSVNCVNAVAGVAWSTGATPAGACRAGTNNLEGYLTWGASDTAQFSVGLPLDWNSAVNPSVSLQVATTETTSARTIIMQIATACSKGDGSTTDDVAFNTAQSLGTVTTNTTANQQWKTTLANITMTNCTAGGILRLKLSRTTDTATNVRVYGLGITIPRLLTIQAN